MNFSTRLCFIGILFISAIRLNAQIGLILPVINNVQPGAIIQVPVRVENFDSIVGMQFIIRWDKTVISFDTISKYSLAGLDPTDFNFPETQDSGFLRMVWTAPSSTNGITLADKTAIFIMQFVVVGPANSGTALQFSESIPSLYLEIVDKHGKAFTINQVEMTTGFVAIGYTVGVQDPNPSPLSLGIMPNPSSDLLNIIFSLPVATDVQLSVSDLSGKIVFKKHWTDLSAGNHSIQLTSSDLSGRGIYVVSLASDGYRNSQVIKRL